MPVDLRAGDVLRSFNGEVITIEQVQHEILESPVSVYNFEVEDYHTYFVGILPAGLGVHDEWRSWIFQCYARYFDAKIRKLFELKMQMREVHMILFGILKYCE